MTSSVSFLPLVVGRVCVGASVTLSIVSGVEICNVSLVRLRPAVVLETTPRVLNHKSGTVRCHRLRRWVALYVFRRSCGPHRTFFLLANRMYEFTFTIVDGVPKIDRRDDLSHDLNDQAQAMTRAVVSEHIVQFTAGDVRISLRED